MNTLLKKAENLWVLCSSGTSASGDESRNQTIDECYFQNDQHDHTPDVRKGEILRLYNELFDTYNECNEDNWDGYGGKAVSYGAFNNAGCFIRLLPATLELPEVGPTNEGFISFDWSNGHDKMVTVIVNEDAEIYFSILNGYKRRTGYDHLDEGVSDDFFRYIRELYE